MLYLADNEQHEAGSPRRVILRVTCGRTKTFYSHLIGYAGGTRHPADAALKLSALLGQANIGPKVYCTVGNTNLEEFFSGRCVHVCASGDMLISVEGVA